MSELRDILKEEYIKKEEDSFTPQVLMEMIEEIYSAMESKVIVEGADKLERGKRKEEETIDIALPFVQLSEAWGKVNSEHRDQIDEFVKQIGVDVSGAGPIGTLRSRLDRLRRFTTTMLDPASTEAQETLPISKVIANILLLDTLAAIVTGGEEAEYSPSPAGFLFEGFVAALAGGDSQQIKAAAAGTIADVTLGSAEDGVPVSLKLLSRSGGGVHGSVADLVKSFGESSSQLLGGWAPEQPAAVTTEGRKPSAPETVWRHDIDPETGEEERYLAYVATGERVSPEEHAVADPHAGKDIVGMKYIIVLKDYKAAGTVLEFYEFDFTLEKFNAWVEGKWQGKKIKKRIPRHGADGTQFNLGKTDYIYGPGGKGSRTGSVMIMEPFELPTSKNVRLLAQKVLKDLYRDFYNILKTLKATTDSLNAYLSNPEDAQPKGKEAAVSADKLEKDIMKTTDDDDFEHPFE